MAGVVNPSMPVWVARDEATGKVAWCPLNEGSGAVLRYGADGPEVLERLKWMRDVLAPGAARGAARAGPLDLYDLHVRSLALGDEAHHRTEQGTALTLEALGIEHPEVRAFIAGNGQFFLNLAMVFAKLALDCAADVPGSPVLTAIARNGVEVGIRVSGHRRPLVRRPGRAARPGEAVRRLHARRHEPGPRRLRDRRDVRARRAGRRRLAARRRPRSASTRPTSTRSRPSCGRSRPASRPTSAIPDGRAAILGIDARKVAATRISPPVHTGIAHRRPGVGQIGGGVTHPPLQAFDARRRGARLTRADAGPPRAARRAARAATFPYGQRLVEEQLAERFATSRTPVREALRRLEGDGHVVRDRSGGVRPNPPRVSAMRELYDVRIVLEDLAVRTADPERLDGAASPSGSSCAPSTTTARTSSTPTRRFHEGIARASRQQRDRALHPRHQRAHPPDPHPRLHDRRTGSRRRSRSTSRSSTRSRPGAPTRPRRSCACTSSAVRGSRGAPRGRAARAHVRGGAAVRSRSDFQATASSPARSAVVARDIATARSTRAGAARAQVVDPPERRPAYDVFGPPAAPLPALGGLPTPARSPPRRGRSTPAHTASSSTRRRSRGSPSDEWTAFVEVDAESALAQARARDAELRAGRRAGRCTASPSPSRTSSTSRGVPHALRLRRLRRASRPTTPTPSTSGAPPAP